MATEEVHITILSEPMIWPGLALPYSSILLVSYETPWGGGAAVRSRVLSPGCCRHAYFLPYGSHACTNMLIESLSSAPPPPLSRLPRAATAAAVCGAVLVPPLLSCRPLPPPGGQQGAVAARGLPHLIVEGPVRAGREAHGRDHHHPRGGSQY